MQPRFDSDVLPAHEAAWVAEHLWDAVTPDAVRAVFERQRLGQWGEAPAPVATRDKDDQEEHTGIMVACMLPADAAEQLCQRRDEDLRLGKDIQRLPPDEMHITLAFLGDSTDAFWTPGQQKALCRAVRSFAEDQLPPSATLDSVGRFHNVGGDEDGLDAVYASVKSKDLVAFRKALVASLSSAGFPVDTKFPDYTPHATLAYIPADEPTPPIEVPALTLTFDRVTVAIGGTHHTYPLGEEQLAHNDARSTTPVVATSTAADPLDALASALVDRLSVVTTAAAIEQSISQGRELRALVMQAIGGL